jgi:hypothetical protein
VSFESSIDLNSQTYHADICAVGIRLLEGLRKTTRKPADLEWEIRLYKWILQQPDPEATAKQYFEMRENQTDPFMPLGKRETVKRLGWVVP